jgi:hypothetical protein
MWAVTVLFADWQGRVERRLRESAIPTVLLRSAFYMTNMLTSASQRGYSAATGRWVARRGGPAGNARDRPAGVIRRRSCDAIRRPSPGSHAEVTGTVPQPLFSERGNSGPGTGLNSTSAPKAVPVQKRGISRQGEREVSQPRTEHGFSILCHDFTLNLSPLGRDACRPVGRGVSWRESPVTLLAVVPSGPPRHPGAFLSSARRLTTTDSRSFDSAQDRLRENDDTSLPAEQRVIELLRHSTRPEFIGTSSPDTSYLGGACATGRRLRQAAPAETTPPLVGGEGHSVPTVRARARDNVPAGCRRGRGVADPAGRRT